MMTLIDRTCALRWGQTRAGPAVSLGCGREQDRALRCDTVQRTVCNWFVTCRHLAVSRRTQIPPQWMLFSRDAFLTLKKSHCRFPGASGPGDQLTRRTGISKPTPSGDPREAERSLSPGHGLSTQTQPKTSLLPPKILRC